MDDDQLSDASTIEITRQNGSRVSFLVDRADFERVLAAGPWSLCSSGNKSTLYVVRRNGNAAATYLQRFLLADQLGPKQRVYFRNGDTLDYRRTNLVVGASPLRQGRCYGKLAPPLEPRPSHVPSKRRIRWPPGAVDAAVKALWEAAVADHDPETTAVLLFALCARRGPSGGSKPYRPPAWLVAEFHAHRAAIFEAFATSSYREAAALPKRAYP